MTVTLVCVLQRAQKDLTKYFALLFLSMWRLKWTAALQYLRSYRLSNCNPLISCNSLILNNLDNHYLTSGDFSTLNLQPLDVSLTPAGSQHQPLTFLVFSLCLHSSSPIIKHNCAIDSHWGCTRAMTQILDFFSFFPHIYNLG